MRVFQLSGEKSKHNLKFVYAADTLGFTTYPPAYLSPQASGKNLLIGANFASAASGYDEKAATLNVKSLSFYLLQSTYFFYMWINFICLTQLNLFWQHAISLPQQLQYFREYQAKLNKVAGSKKAETIIKGALYLLSAGSSDFVQNYYVNPFLYKVYTPDQYGDFLIGAFISFITVPSFSLIATSLKSKIMRLKF